MPEISAQKIAGLKKHYGISAEPALRYFAVHEEADVRHRGAWRLWLEGQPVTECAPAFAAGERALKALWGALDAVYPKGCTGTVKN